MRNRIKSSSATGSWLAALARRLRDWLNHYLSDDASLVVEGGGAESAREKEADAPQSPAQGSLDPLEHWFDLVRESAPELLIALEEGGTPWLYAGQAQDAGNSEEVILPENQEAAEPSGAISSSVRGPQEAKDKQQAKGPQQPKSPQQPRRKTRPSVDSATHAAATPPQSAQRTTNEPTARKTNAALSQADERRGHAVSKSQVDCTTNETTHVQQPPLKPMVERKATGRQMDRMEKEISLPKELPTQVSISMQPDLVTDAGSARPAMPSAVHNVPHDRFAMENGAALAPRSAPFTPCRAHRISNQAHTFIKGSNRDETVERQQNINLDSAAALSGRKVAANQPSIRKQPPSPSVQVKPLVRQPRQPRFNEAGYWPALPASEQNGFDLPILVQPLPEQPGPDDTESTGDRWPLFTRTGSDTPVPVSNLKAESSSDLWPELPEGPPLEDIDDARFFRDLKHVQALDLEQGGN